MVARFIASSCSLTRPFRLALVILLLIIIPQIAWGQDDGTTYTFTGTSVTGNTGTATSTAGGTAYNWNIKELQFMEGNNQATSINPTYSNSSLGISNIGDNNNAITTDFQLESDFGLTGSFVKAEITFSISHLTNAVIDIYKDVVDDNTAKLSRYTINGFSNNDNTITIERPSQYINNRLFDDNKIVFRFNFTANYGNQEAQEASFSITSIKIYTTEYFGLTVGRVRVSSGNYKNITGGNISFGSGGNASFDPNERILTLNNANINNCIYSYGNLTVDLQGINSIIPDLDSCAIKNTNGTSTAALVFMSTEGTGKLEMKGLGNPCTYDFNSPSYQNELRTLLGAYNSGYAVIGKQLFSGGDGTSGTPYLINSTSDLKDFSKYVSLGFLDTGTILLNNDIDCSNLTGFEPIGNSTYPFKAFFKGNYKTISNLTVTSTGAAGLFGVMSNATIENLNLSDCTITGGEFAGALVGDFDNSGAISSVKVKGSTSVTAQKPGAIIGHAGGGNLNSNRYEYTVTTTVTGGATSSGYTPRAAGQIGTNAGGDVTNTDNAILYTRLLSVTAPTYGGTLETWYPTSNTYTNNHNFAPGQTAYVKATPYTGFEASSVAVTYTDNGTQTITAVLDATNSTDSYKIFSFTMPDADDVTASVTYASTSGIIVSGHAPAADGSITGTGIAGTVTFNSTNNTLTLNGANIIGVIESSLGDLTIHLTGGNTIRATDTGTSVINSTNAGTVTFETDATTGNQLSFLKSNGGYFDAIPINGFTVAYEAGLGYNSQFSEIIESLTIEYNNSTYKLHSSNANNIVGDGKVSYSYDSTNGCVLTLNNGNVGCIEWKISDNLTIAINGTCSVSNTGHTYAINSNGNGNVSFVKASGASNAELTLKWGSGSDPVAAPSSTLGSGLYWKPTAATTIVITDDPNFVIIENYIMTDTRTINGTTGTITYNSTDKILTISGFQKDFGTKHAIKTGVTGLKVKLIGESTINCAADSAIFHAISSSASIQLVRNDDASKLTMTGTAFNNFAADNITYDGLVYYSANTNNYIAIPTPPTMAVDNNNKVELTIDYSGGAIAFKYSIDYADETTDVTNATYSAPFEMAAPGTVTAWVEANGATTSSVKGKKFGYQGAPIIMNPGETNTPVLIPAIENVDNIDYATSDPYVSADPGIATFEGGVITAVSSGDVNLTTSLTTTGASVTTVILNSNNQFNTVVKVSTDISGIFQGQNQYGTYYNAADNYTIPSGMEAYIVTGVSNNQVVLKSLSVLPKQTPLLLYKGTATTFYSATTDETDDASNNKLKYADPVVTTTGKEFVLYNDEFVMATGDIPVGRCYLDLNGVSFTRGAYDIGDGTTAIKGITLSEGEEAWYDLQGRRIERPTKPGLYIRNGKKVVVNNK